MLILTLANIMNLNTFRRRFFSGISAMLIARLETVNLTVFRERGFYLGVARLYGTKSLVRKTQVEPIGHSIKLFSADCLQTELSLHSSACSIFCLIFAIN